MDLKLVLLAVLLLLFCSEVSSSHLQKREAPQMFTNLQETIAGYFTETSQAVQSVLEKIEDTAKEISGKATQFFGNCADSINPYLNILWDQVTFTVQGDQ